ncbi:NYN domain-containing protein [Salinisphaera sp. P385]|uniref:NYN domain-containing protein n=1 Tax=Spectribacter acetivorans TaxID=3075603 RepID=A0ABU3BCR3_9GAMM|nr:NYN domain-containing protein [Salinisphaera sp. P385]MDT0619890.1 NYN domain-containing protein [Salinisphaera sp. P385]
MRRIAILIDGGYFLKRLPKLVEPRFCTTPQQIAESARFLCKRHVQKLTGLDDGSEADGRWLDQVYRLFYYDASPYSGKSHHPIGNQPIDFGKTETAKARSELFAELRSKRKFALRLGHVTQDGGWQIDPRLSKDLLKIRKWADHIEQALLEDGEAPQLKGQEQRELANLLERWKGLTEQSVRFGLRQKGVDMRIGLDIASMALKQQADTLILVTGDSDFVPAAKLARREGMEFIVDPLWQKVSDDLLEHVDGIVSVYQRPAPGQDAKDGN